MESKQRFPLFQPLLMRQVISLTRRATLTISLVQKIGQSKTRLQVPAGHVLLGAAGLGAKQPRQAAERIDPHDRFLVLTNPVAFRDALDDFVQARCSRPMTNSL